MDKIIEQVDLVNRWVLSQLKEIEKLPSEIHRRILILSIIDAFAQHESGYIHGKGNSIAGHFSEFLIKYSSSYKDILSAVCPVTLYYDCCDRYEFGYLKLVRCRIYSALDKELLQEVERISKIIPEDSRRILIDKHKYARLIYAMRNKLVHELKPIYAPIDFHANQKNPLPHICTESIDNEESLVPYRWALQIPEEFLKNVLKDAVQGYLGSCMQEDREPFSNNRDDRRCLFAWYD